MATVTLSPDPLKITITATAQIAPVVSQTELVVETGSGTRGANTYVTLRQAQQYFVGRRLFSSAWNAADDTTKGVALRQASFLLDNEFTWSGITPVNPDQGLAWPFKDATDRYGNAVVGVPRAVRDATCEVALYILAQDRLVEQQGVGLTSLKVDVISLVFDKAESPKLFPPHVSRMLVGYGSPTSSCGGILTTRLVRV